MTVSTILKRFTAWRETDRKDALLAASTTFVVALFFVLDTRTHRDVFYLFYLLPVLVLYRPADFRQVVKLRAWQGVAALAVFTAVSALWAYESAPYAVLDEFRVVAIFLVFLTVCFRLALTKALTLEGLFRWVVPVAAVSGLAALAYALGVDRGPMDRIEGFGRTNHPIIGASLFAATMLAAMALGARARGTKGSGWLGWLFIAAIAVFAGFIVLSESRGPLLALMAGLVTMACFRRLPAIAMAAGVVAVAALALFLTGQIDFLTWIERGTSYRLDLWGEAISLWAERPLFGYGAATDQLFTVGDLSYRSPHNVFVATAYYTGLVGLALFLWVVWLSLRPAFMLARQGQPIYLALLVFALVAMALDSRTVFINLAREWFIFWLPFIFAVAASEQSRGTAAREAEARREPEIR